MGYKIIQFIIHLLLPLFARVEVCGIENLPDQKSYIIASNHLGRLDIPLIYYLLNRQEVILLVAEKYRENALLRWFFGLIHGIWVDRFNADFAALRAVLHRLEQGGVLVVAPEGTRSPTASLLPGRPGASYLAVKAGVPVVPVGLTGSEDHYVLEELRNFRRPRVIIHIGVPFTLPSLQGRERGQAREAALEAYTDEIMCRIAALLPPPYRGVYAGHPRLAELLS